MTNILNMKTLMYWSAFLLLALPAFYVGPLRVTVITTIFAFFIYIIFFNKQFISEIITTLKLKTTKQILLLFAWIVISGFLSFAFGLCPIETFLLNVLFRFIPLVIFPYFLGCYFAKNFPKQEIIKFYYILFLFVFFIGLVDFICGLIDFPLLKYTIVNHRGIEGQAMYGGLTRVRSVFDEPSYMGWFLAVHLPIMYKMFNYKFKIFQNKYLNLVAKKLSPIFAWVMIFLGMSPMFVFIFFAESILYKLFTTSKNIKETVKKMILSLFLIMIFLVLFLNLDFSNSFLGRIQKVISALTNLEVLIYAEPSLGNRILCYISSFLVFFKHPFIGVGFGCSLPHVYNELRIIDLPLTYEIQVWLSTPKSAGCNYAILWTTLAENGFIGTIILYNIFFTCLKQTYKKVKFVFTNQLSFIYGLFYSLIAIIVLSIYDSGITLSYIWFLVGILSCLNYIHSRRRKNV